MHYCSACRCAAQAGRCLFVCCAVGWSSNQGSQKQAPDFFALGTTWRRQEITQTATPTPRAAAGARGTVAEVWVTKPAGQQPGLA